MPKFLSLLFASLLSTSIATSFHGAAAADEVVCDRDTDLGHSLNLPIYCWKDSTQPMKAIILAIHGATLHAGTFDETAKHLAGEGYVVYAIDMRGFGRWRTESNSFNADSGIHYSQSKEDLLLILNQLRQDYPRTKIFPMGESVGANLAIWIASNEPKFIDGAIISSPCIKSILHKTPKTAIGIVKMFINPNKKLALKPHIQPYLSDDERVTDGYINDPNIMKDLSTVELLKSMKTNKQALAGVKDIPAQLPLLIMAGQKDEIYSSKAVPDFANSMGSLFKTVVIEPSKGHLLLETKFVEPAVLTLIDGWLAKATGISPEAVTQTSQAAPETVPAL
ncbi:MAG: alpha/beta fold hydrolase [Candidatus Obscuribacterales bacterium]|nr:alpha/beta fold hydrolase [Candidatus Obscuribacterales bacterium]